ncbi:kynurenine/alpha-aminoadipate aminotransferase, mitochondrial-like isoform X2 [Arctopsyche grandis]
MLLRAKKCWGYTGSVRRSSSARINEAKLEENFDVSARQIKDYSKYISDKSSLREPSITRTLTALTYKAGKNLISLAEGMPNEKVFPFKEINILLKDGTKLDLINKELDIALQYIPSQGYPKLLTNLKEFQKKIHNPPNWEDRDIIVTSGSQDGIYKSIELLVNKGDPVLFPTPLYSGTDIIMKPYKPKVLEVKQDSKGLNPENLRSVLETHRKTGQIMPKVIYINPTGNNPTGTVIPNDRRQEIYDIACEYDLIILEDDPYHFMHFNDEVPKSFISYDVEGRVLRFDSLSKVLSSGLRLGWITGPKPLISVIELHMQASYLHTATLTQVIANKLLETWGLDGMVHHLNTVREFYRERRTCLINLLEKHLTGLAEWDTPEAGMFVWVKIKGVPDVYDMIFRKAIERGISFVPGHAFTISSGAPCPYIRVTYSKSSPQDMEEACIRLAKLIREEQKLYAG